MCVERERESERTEQNYERRGQGLRGLLIHRFHSVIQRQSSDTTCVRGDHAERERVCACSLRLNNNSSKAGPGIHRDQQSLNGP